MCMLKQKMVHTYNSTDLLSHSPGLPAVIRELRGAFKDQVLALLCLAIAKAVIRKGHLESDLKSKVNAILGHLWYYSVVEVGTSLTRDSRLADSKPFLTDST